MKYIASCSFGKDSLATVLLCLEHGEPLDEVVYCEVMFDENTSGEVPEHRDFIFQTAIPFLEGHGIKVVTLRSPCKLPSAVSQDLRKRQERREIERLAAVRQVLYSARLQTPPIAAYMAAVGQDVVQYIGIADDEQERLFRLKAGRHVSLLKKYGKTEDDATLLCKKAGLYSPIYSFARRNGCFFCPNAGIRELRHLYDYHPDLWNKLLACQAAQNKATELFNRTDRFDEIDARFRFEDLQISLDLPAA